MNRVVLAVLHQELSEDPQDFVATQLVPFQLDRPK